MEKLNQLTFYNMDKAIRSYRMFAQKRLKEQGFDITIDQWLVIKSLMENPGISQQELGEKVFKDKASVTRIIELLVKSGYLERNVHDEDRRKSDLRVTESGEKIIKDVHKVVLRNREDALAGFNRMDLKILNTCLFAIIQNCK